MPALSVCERANYQSPHWQPIRANPAIKIHTHHDERFAVKTARDDDCLSGPSCYEAHHPAGLANPVVQRKKLSSWLSPQLVSLQMMLVALLDHLPWPGKWSSGSYCGLFLFWTSSTQPASSPPPAENESLVVLSPAHSSCGPQPEAVLPPCEALRRMRSSTSLSFRTRRGVWIIPSSMRTTLPYQADIRCLDLLIWSCARCTSKAGIFPIWVKWNVRSQIFGACAL